MQKYTIVSVSPDEEQLNRILGKTPKNLKVAVLRIKDTQMYYDAYGPEQRDHLLEAVGNSFDPGENYYAVECWKILSAEDSTKTFDVDEKFFLFLGPYEAAKLEKQVAGFTISAHELLEEANKPKKYNGTDGFDKVHAIAKTGEVSNVNGLVAIIVNELYK